MDFATADEEMMPENGTGFAGHLLGKLLVGNPDVLLI